MKAVLTLLIALSLAAFPSVVSAETVSGLPLHIQSLDDGVIRLWLGDQESSTAVVAFATEDGIVVVDTMGSPGVDREIRKIIARELGRDDFVMLINTHEHGDHTGGNAAYVDCEIAGHELVAQGMPSAVEGEPVPAPTKTFAERLDLEVGGTTFELSYIGGMHSPSDIAVFVPRYGLLMTGDTMADVWLIESAGCLTSFTTRRGIAHDFPLMLENWNRLLDRRDEIATLMPAHWNGELTLAGCEARVRYVETLWNATLETAAAGDGILTMLVDYRLESRFPELVDSPGCTGWNNYGTIVEMWAEVTGQTSAVAAVIEQLESGAGREAVNEILAQRDADEPAYYYLESEFNINGYGYLERERPEFAVELLRANTVLFPDSWNSYDSLGEALLASGEREAAIAMYEKSLELNPESESGLNALERIRAEGS